MGTQIPKKVPMGTRVPKWGPIWEQWGTGNIKRGPKSPKRSPWGPGDPKGDPLGNSESQVWKKVKVPELVLP